MPLEKSRVRHMLHGGYLSEDESQKVSTYVISDIHGALEAFILLLSEIGFDPESREDELYLLGDYADWGTHSIETIGYVMDLDANPNVHCLMGNHDLMFLQAIEEDRKMLSEHAYGMRQIKASRPGMTMRSCQRRTDRRYLTG